MFSVITVANPQICSTGLLRNVGFEEWLLASDDADGLYQVFDGRHKQFARASSSGWQTLRLRGTHLVALTDVSFRTGLHMPLLSNSRLLKIEIIMLIMILYTRRLRRMLGLLSKKSVS